MKLKKSLSIVIVALFIIVAVFSFIGLFSVKKINATFSVSENTDVAPLQERLDEFLDKNILFVNEEDVYKALEDFHYMEIVSVDKQFPNVINVTVNERREIYYVDYNDNYLIMADDGFVLRTETKTDEIIEGRDKILLSLDSVNVIDATIGKYIKTDRDELINTVFEMAKSVNLTDCIKKVTVFYLGEDYNNVTFGTHTGVNIVIEEPEDDGKKKAVEGFTAYDKQLSDYIKMFDTITVNKTEQGVVKVTWTENN